MNNSDEFIETLRRSIEEKDKENARLRNELKEY